VLSIVWKILVALVTGSVTFLLTSVANGPVVWTVTLSVFLAGVVLVVEFLLDAARTLDTAMRTQERRLAELERSVTASLNGVDRAGRLLNSLETSALEASATSTGPVTRFIEGVVRFVPPSPILARLAIEEVKGVTDLIDGLTAGSASYPGEDRDWLLALTRCACSRISATSTTAVDGGKRNFSDGFWKSELGRSYLQAQRDAVNRGVHIRRVFILNKPGIVVNPDFVATCEEQQGAGVVVRTIVVQTGQQASWTSTFRDFILFDDSVSYEVELGAPLGSRPGIASTNLRFDQIRVNERKVQFEEIWAAAQPFGQPPE
jgi:hypothetical protein